MPLASGGCEGSTTFYFAVAVLPALLWLALHRLDAGLKGLRSVFGSAIFALQILVANFQTKG